MLAVYRDLSTATGYEWLHLRLTTGKSPYYTKLRAGNTNYYVDNTGCLETLRSDTTVLSMPLSSELQSLSFNLLLLILPSPGPSPPMSMSFRIRLQTGSAHGRSPSHHSPHQVCFRLLMRRTSRKAKPPKEARPEALRPSAPHSLVFVLRIKMSVRCVSKDTAD